MNWLILDGNFLCYRAFHTTGQLSYEDEGTGVLYGVYQTVESLKDQFAVKNVVWAFDQGKGKRRELLPSYKAQRRKDKTEEELLALKNLYKQIDRLQHKYLRKMGYKNIFSQPGYEADDIIASVCLNLGDGDRGIIVTADKDMYQLIADNVVVYNPITKQTWTRQYFGEQYNSTPELWASVKAIVGDPSDNIDGIKGVGFVSAAKWFNGTLREGNKQYDRISEGIGIHNENYPLIKLPFPGTEIFELREDKVTGKKRQKVLDKLGFQRVKGVRGKKDTSKREHRRTKEGVTGGAGSFGFGK